MMVDEASAPTVSVIVCTYNGARWLSAALQSLKRQKCTFELLVVDDGSTDGTRAIAERLGVRVVTLAENAGLPAARNAGIALTSGDIVAFTDDDCTVDPDWVDQIRAAFSEDPELDGVSGPVMPEAYGAFLRAFLRVNNPLVPLSADLLRSNGLVYRLRLYLEHTVLGRPPKLGALYSVVGANMAFSRAALLSIDGFDESLGFGGEEEDACRRLHDRDGGARLKYVDGLSMTHWFDARIGDTLRRSRAYGRGNARMSIKHAGMRPVVFPTPFILVGLAIYALISRRARDMLLLHAAFLGAYPSWIGGLRDRRDVRTLAWAYLQFAQEVATMVGEAAGFREGYDPRPPQYLSLAEEQLRRGDVARASG